MQKASYKCSSGQQILINLLMFSYCGVKSEQLSLAICAHPIRMHSFRGERDGCTVAAFFSFVRSFGFASVVAILFRMRFRLRALNSNSSAWFFAHTKWLRDRLDFFVGAAVRICIVLIGRRNWNAVVSKVGLIYTLT